MYHDLVYPPLSIINGLFCQSLHSLSRFGTWYYIEIIACRVGIVTGYVGSEFGMTSEDGERGAIRKPSVHRRRVRVFESRVIEVVCWMGQSGRCCIALCQRAWEQSQDSRASPGTTPTNRVIACHGTRSLRAREEGETGPVWKQDIIKWVNLLFDSTGS